MTTSILLRSPAISSPLLSTASSPLPPLQPDLSSSCLVLQRTASSRSRRIRFASLPEPDRDFLDPNPQSLPNSAPQIASPSGDPHDDFVALSPTISPVSTLSSAQSTPTIHMSSNASSRNTSVKLLHSLSFFRRSSVSSPNGSPLSQSPSLSGSSDPSPVHSSRSISSLPAKLSRISAEFGAKSLFRARSASASGTCPPRTSSPPSKPSDSTNSRHRSASTGSPAGKRDLRQESSRPHHTPTTDSASPVKRPSSSGFSPGAGGGRHASSAKMFTSELPPRPSTAPAPFPARPKKHVKMLNGRVYGAKRYVAQTLADPFATARDEPEFVEWGYGGMGSVHASAGIANDMWRGLQRSERGGALLAGGGDSGASIARRRMSNDIPECGMGNVGADGDEDDGSGLGWVKRRRAEREAKARLEEVARELGKKTREGRKSGDSMDAGMDTSTASTATSLTACTSGASTDLTTPTTSPFTSRSPSIVELKLTPSPCLDPCDLASHTVNEQASDLDAPPTRPVLASKDEQQHHVAVVVSPSHGHTVHRRTTASSLNPLQTGVAKQEALLDPVDTEEASPRANSFAEGEGEQDPSPDEEGGYNVDDEEDEVQDITRKTALGAGVEKVSRHMEVETR